MDEPETLLFYTRKKWGRGFQYFDADNEKLDCPALLKRFKSLAIPPMWTDVQVSADPKYKVQVTGRDAKNRKQYIYHEEWHIRQQQEKFSNIVNFAQQLPKLRKHCLELIKTKDSSKEKVLAIMALILDETGIRVGNPYYTKTNNTHGLTTLRRKHLVSEDGGMRFSFIGKSNKSRNVDIEDRKLNLLIKQCAEQPGYNLFRYQDDASKWRDVDSDEVNDFIREQIGDAYSAKDFRTWNASCLAVEAYHRLHGQFEKSKKSPVNQVIDMVADRLGNTPAICKEYYIHPALLTQISEEGLPPFTVGNSELVEITAEHDIYEIETLKLLRS